VAFLNLYRQNDLTETGCYHTMTKDPIPSIRCTLKIPTFSVLYMRHALWNMV